MPDASSFYLTRLLSSTPYSHLYALPLLFLSFVLTFAGTFLMLDRSRSFPPRIHYSALPGPYEKPRKRNFRRRKHHSSFPKKHRKRRFWVLEGGIGGIACGYTTGLHLATFLSLLIPATTSSAPLSPKSFIAVWVLTCVFTTFLAGRYRYAALTMSGISGGALTSLALSVILHPSITPRIVLMVILVPLLTFVILFFYFVPKFHSRLLHPTLRFCTSSIGAFGIVLSISILLNPRVDAWANVWERLWLRDGETWGTGKERGLSAAYGVFLAAGMVSDWALRRWFGECPDEKWDKYLADYTTNLPNHADRAGMFEPPKSVWDRFFSSHGRKHDHVLFPPDSDLKAPPHLAHRPADLDTPPPAPAPGAFLKKSHAQSKRQPQPQPRKRKPVKFSTIDELSSSEDEDSDHKSSPNAALPPFSYASTSTPTLVEEPPRVLHKKHANDDPAKHPIIDYDAELAELKGSKLDGMPDYSDHEEDLTSPIQSRPPHEQERWSPGFMKRHSSGLSDASAPNIGMPLLSAVPVPATPSLIKALDRIAVAQRQAFGQEATPPTVGKYVPSGATVRVPQKVEEVEEEGDNTHAAEHDRRARAPRWEEFWREVNLKAQT